MSRPCCRPTPLHCGGGSYAVSVKTLTHPTRLTRHLVDVLFGGLFFVLSLLWMSTLEMYDDSIPFGFIFQAFMIPHFLRSTLSLSVLAVGWVEVARVSVTAHVLTTSCDYAIPTTIMLAGVAMHLVVGVVQTTSSLRRAEYPSAEAPLTFFFIMNTLTKISGWLFLSAIDNKYMEDVFMFETWWVYELMWIKAVALAHFISKRATHHRKASPVSNGSGAALDVLIAVSVDAETTLRNSAPASFSSREGRGSKL